MKFDPIRGSIWQSNINTVLGLSLILVVGSWAGIAIIQTAWNINPVSQAFAAMVDRETGY